MSPSQITYAGVKGSRKKRLPFGWKVCWRYWTPPSLRLACVPFPRKTALAP